MKDGIDIAVCYHKPSITFQSDALKPMQLGKAIAGFDLGFRGDDTGDNISSLNKYYSEETAFYWLWKNSEADIKGLAHYRRLLDLRDSSGENRNIALKYIKDASALVEELGLNRKTIFSRLADSDVLVRKSVDIFDWFPCNVEEQYKAIHIPEYWDYMMEIIQSDFPEIYPAANRLVEGHFCWFCNIVIMKAPLFDAMCEFKFGVLEKIEKLVDKNRLEISLEEPTAVRYAAFIGERLMAIYLKYLQESGKKIAEFPLITILSNSGILAKTADMYAYTIQSTESEPLARVFDNNAVAIMFAADNNYAPYCGVAIQSIKDSANPGRNYDIVVVACDLSETNQRLLRAMATQNISIRILEISPFLSGVDMSLFKLRDHFSIETYYRFFIPRIFANYQKVLYLDADMVVLRDVAELYDTHMGDNWWAVTRDKFISISSFMPRSEENKEFLPYIKNTLKMDSPFDYFQAGVMLWNISQCVNDNVEGRCLAKLRELGTPIFLDQCVMNAVANGRHMLYTAGYWNALWFWAFHEAKQALGLEVAIKQINEAYILHFASERKPWMEPALPNADKFWRYARKTPFYEAILLETTKSGEAKISKATQKKIKQCKRKIKKYKILNAITLGLIKHFRERENVYRGRLKILEAM